MGGGSGRPCAVCGRTDLLVARQLGVCRECLIARVEEAWPRVESLRSRGRARFHLPAAPPSSEGGAPCPLCGQGCVIGPGERGFCGLRAGETSDGRVRLVHRAGTSRRGMLQWYRDPIPTNCVARWECAGRSHPGMHNLAVFYCSCTFDCLFCQNWHFRTSTPEGAGLTTADELAACANRSTFCVCFFGGDPVSQMPHALAAGRRLAEAGVTVCWETAGSARPALMDRAVELAMGSGGTVKFDLKAFDPNLHRALTGADNRLTLENFHRAARRAAQRPQRPLVIASTLLVPGYITAEEVGRIAGFVAEVNPATPYSLLAFAPNFLVGDLPRTSRREAEAAEAAARAAGLTTVRVSNRHLLW